MGKLKFFHRNIFKFDANGDGFSTLAGRPEQAQLRVAQNRSRTGWNAEDYDQQNPLITDEACAYAWDVPEGRYYVTCEKEGYDLIKSEDVNSNGEAVDLPKTGNNSMTNLLLVMAAITLMFAGLFIVRRSGVISRKRS